MLSDCLKNWSMIAGAWSPGRRGFAGNPRSLPSDRSPGRCPALRSTLCTVSSMTCLASIEPPLSGPKRWSLGTDASPSVMLSS